MRTVEQLNTHIQNFETLNGTSHMANEDLKFLRSMTFLYVKQERNDTILRGRLGGKIIQDSPDTKQISFKIGFDAKKIEAEIPDFFEGMTSVLIAQFADSETIVTIFPDRVEISIRDSPSDILRYPKNEDDTLAEIKKRIWGKYPLLSCVRHFPTILAELELVQPSHFSFGGPFRSQSYSLLNPFPFDPMKLQKRQIFWLHKNTPRVVDNVNFAAVLLGDASIPDPSWSMNVYRQILQDLEKRQEQALAFWKKELETHMQIDAKLGALNLSETRIEACRDSEGRWIMPFVESELSNPRKRRKMKV